MKKKIIEVCAYSVQSAINAQKGGAQRVELCNNMFEGGTTPSTATIRLARQQLNIKAHVIIRPRGGDFCYSNLEFETMKLDIETAKNLGVDGIVMGILCDDGTVDIKRCRQLIKLSRPMSVTFHRAFDMTSDPFQAMESLIDLGVDRILTSGQRQTAYEGKALITELVSESNKRIIIMPGGGINESNIIEIIKETGACEFHASCKTILRGRMIFKNPSIRMGNSKDISECEIIESDPDIVSRLVHLVQSYDDE